jgi:hypothetical protein
MEFFRDENGQAFAKLPGNIYQPVTDEQVGYLMENPGRLDQFIESAIARPAGSIYRVGNR